MSGRVADESQGTAQVGLHQRQCGDQSGRFITAVLWNVFAQVIGRNALRNVQRLTDRLSQAAGVHPGQKQGSNHADRDKNTHHQQGLLISRFGLITRFFRFAVVDADEFFQRVFDLIRRNFHVAIGNGNCPFQIARCNRGQVAILGCLIVGVGFAELVECLTPLRGNDQFAERVRKTGNQRAGLLNVAKCLGPAILRLKGVTKSGVIAPDTDKLPVQRAEQFYAG